MEGLNLNTETLKSSLIFSSRTGNPVLDTLTTGLIVCLTTYLMSFCALFQNINYIDLIKKCFGWKQDIEPFRNQITISGKEKDGCKSDTFLALINRIKTLDCVSSKISELSEISGDSPYCRRDGSDYSDSSDDEEVKITDENQEGTGAALIVSQDRPFIIAKDVEARVNIFSSESKNEEGGRTDEKTKTEEYQTITISSSILTMDELRRLLNQWLKKYKDSMLPNDYLRYFMLNSCQSYRQRYEYEEYRFQSSKSFDNIFFPQKQEIMKQIDYFTKNKEWYRKRGVPHTIGFLFYGEPGCGKTSTIKAIANYTNRHVVSVPLSKINSCKDLMSIFYQTEIEHRYIPLHRRLYVLEDIDCDDLKKVVKTRKTQNPQDSDQNINDKSLETTALLLKNLLKSGNELDKEGNQELKSSDLTLAGILEALDGVMEMEGRMLIMTTNYPERLDEALIRPGRIDMKVKFGKCTTSCLVQMYEHFFDDLSKDEIWPENFNTSDLPADRWTPAEAVQVLLRNTKNPKDALNDFINKIPQSTFKSLNNRNSELESEQTNEESTKTSHTSDIEDVKTDSDAS